MFDLAVQLHKAVWEIELMPSEEFTEWGLYSQLRAYEDKTGTKATTYEAD